MNPTLPYSTLLARLLAFSILINSPFASTSAYVYSPSTPSPALSASAPPLPPSSIPVVQAYGLTETAAGGTFTHQEDLSVGRVGPPICSAYIQVGASSLGMDRRTARRSTTRTVQRSLMH